MLQELGGEYSGCGNLCRRVVLQDVIDLLPLVSFSNGFRTESGYHCRNGACVVVHTVILGMYTLAE